ncbi:MAG: hypothetical protein Q8P95_05475 [bacterium]|nr:hypothetical protein [bacterium]
MGAELGIAPGEPQIDWSDPEVEQDSENGDALNLEDIHEDTKKKIEELLILKQEDFENVEFHDKEAFKRAKGKKIEELQYSSGLQGQLDEHVDEKLDLVYEEWEKGHEIVHQKEELKIKILAEAALSLSPEDIGNEDFHDDPDVFTAAMRERVAKALEDKNEHYVEEVQPFIEGKIEELYQEWLKKHEAFHKQNEDSIELLIDRALVFSPQDIQNAEFDENPAAFAAAMRERVGKAMAAADPHYAQSLQVLIERKIRTQYQKWMAKHRAFHRQQQAMLLPLVRRALVLRPEDIGNEDFDGNQAAFAKAMRERVGKSLGDTDPHYLESVQPTVDRGIKTLYREWQKKHQLFHKQGEQKLAVLVEGALVLSQSDVENEDFDEHPDVFYATMRLRVGGALSDVDDHYQEDLQPMVERKIKSSYQTWQKKHREFHHRREKVAEILVDSALVLSSDDSENEAYDGHQRAFIIAMQERVGQALDGFDVHYTDRLQPSVEKKIAELYREWKEKHESFHHLEQEKLSEAAELDPALSEEDAESEEKTIEDALAEIFVLSPRDIENEDFDGDPQAFADVMQARILEAMGTIDQHFTDPLQPALKKRIDGLYREWQKKHEKFHDQKEGEIEVLVETALILTPEDVENEDFDGQPEAFSAVMMERANLALREVDPHYRKPYQAKLEKSIEMTYEKWLKLHKEFHRQKSAETQTLIQATLILKPEDIENEDFDDRPEAFAAAMLERVDQALLEVDSHYSEPLKAKMSKQIEALYQQWTKKHEEFHARQELGIEARIESALLVTVEDIENEDFDGRPEAFAAAMLGRVDQALSEVDSHYSEALRPQIEKQIEALYKNWTMQHLKFHEGKENTIDTLIESVLILTPEDVENEDFDDRPQVFATTMKARISRTLAQVDPHYVEALEAEVDKRIMSLYGKWQKQHRSFHEQKEGNLETLVKKALTLNSEDVENELFDKHPDIFSRVMNERVDLALVGVDRHYVEAIRPSISSLIENRYQNWQEKHEALHRQRELEIAMAIDQKLTLSAEDIANEAFHDSKEAFIGSMKQRAGSLLVPENTHIVSNLQVQIDLKIETLYGQWLRGHLTLHENEETDAKALIYRSLQLNQEDLKNENFHDSEAFARAMVARGTMLLKQVSGDEQLAPDISDFMTNHVRVLYKEWEMHHGESHRMEEARAQEEEKAAETNLSEKEAEREAEQKVLEKLVRELNAALVEDSKQKNISLDESKLMRLYFETRSGEDRLWSILEEWLSIINRYGEYEELFIKIVSDLFLLGSCSFKQLSSIFFRRHYQGGRPSLKKLRQYFSMLIRILLKMSVQQKTVPRRPLDSPRGL